jgi:hypothetical protein
LNRVLVAGLLFSLVIIIIGTTNHITSVLAQVNSSGLANITNTSSKDTFAASGKISSLIFVHEKASNNTSGMKTTTNNSDAATSSVIAKKFVLSGNWNLKVENGMPTAFTAKFIKVLSDGNRWHTHELTNFKSNNNTRVELKPDNSVSSSGTVDVKLNNTSPWNATNVNIMIAKGKTISVILDDNATGDHFQGQPIYGIVESIKDANGNEMLSAQHQIIQRLQQ